MTDNSKNINDFDKYIKNQIETISYDFDENNWEQLHDKLNQINPKNSSLLYKVNYKSLFFITSSLLVLTLGVSIFYYWQTNNATKEISTPVIEATTDNPRPLDYKSPIIDSMKTEADGVIQKDKKLKNNATQQVVQKPILNEPPQKELAPQENQNEIQQTASDSSSTKKKAKKYIVW